MKGLQQLNEGVPSVCELTDVVPDGTIEGARNEQSIRIKSVLSFLKASQSAY